MEAGGLVRLSTSCEIYFEIDVNCDLPVVQGCRQIPILADCVQHALIQCWVHRLRQMNILRLAAFVNREADDHLASCEIQIVEVRR